MQDDPARDRSERFFTWVWRVDALLLLALGLLGIALSLAVAFEIGAFAARERPGEQLAEVAGADLSAQGLRLADFEAIAGTSLLYAELASPSDSIGSGSSGGWGYAHNLLFFDTSSKRAHWLLPDNDQTLPSFAFLMDPPASRYFDRGEARARNQRAVALLVEIREERNGAPSGAGTRTLGIALPDGRAMAPIAQSIQGVLGYHHARADALFVFYVSEGAARVLDVDPLARTVRSDTPLGARE